MAKGNLIYRLRLTLLRLLESIGTTASNMASNAKLRANEIKLENRRREILSSFSLRAFELWQKGVTLPDSLSEMLTELSDIENRLSVLRAQKYAKVAPDSANGAPAESLNTPSCTVSDGDGGESNPVPCDFWSGPVPEEAAEPESAEPQPEAPPADVKPEAEPVPDPSANTETPQA